MALPEKYRGYDIEEIGGVLRHGCPLDLPGPNMRENIPPTQWTYKVWRFIRFTRAVRRMIREW